jgi:uncharacterized DUF497 family protein
MKLEWDESKRLSNLAKHALDFADAATVLSGIGFEIEDTREDYPEARFRYFGFLKGFMVLVVYSPRQDGYRIISMRKATANEEKSVLSYLFPDQGQ